MIVYLFPEVFIAMVVFAIVGLELASNIGPGFTCVDELLIGTLVCNSPLPAAGMSLSWVEKRVPYILEYKSILSIRRVAILEENLSILRDSYKSRVYKSKKNKE